MIGTVEAAVEQMRELRRVYLDAMTDALADFKRLGAEREAQRVQMRIDLMRYPQVKAARDHRVAVDRQKRAALREAPV